MYRLGYLVCHGQRTSMTTSCWLICCWDAGVSVSESRQSPNVSTRYAAPCSMYRSVTEVHLQPPCSTPFLHLLICYCLRYSSLSLYFSCGTWTGRVGCCWNKSIYQVRGTQHSRRSFSAAFLGFALSNYCWLTNSTISALSSVLAKRKSNFAASFRASIARARYAGQNTTAPERCTLNRPSVLAHLSGDGFDFIPFTPKLITPSAKVETFR